MDIVAEIGGVSGNVVANTGNAVTQAVGCLLLTIVYTGTALPPGMPGYWPTLVLQLLQLLSCLL